MTMIEFEVSKPELEELKRTIPSFSVILEALREHAEINFRAIEMSENDSRDRCVSSPDANA